MKQILLMLTLGGLLACNNPNPTTNQNPVAAFNPASTSIKAGDALLFTSSSSDPDNDVLTQSWDFGDDTRGGGSSIAHVFAGAGAFTVKLTVGDGKGGVNSTTQSITVTAGTPLGTPLSVTGSITDTTGAALTGVTIKLGSSVLGASDAAGKAVVSVPTGVSQTLMLSKDGFVDQVVALEFPLGSNASNVTFKAALLTQGTPQTVNASTGGMLKGADNAMLVLPASGLETAGGASVTGDVQVSITPLDINDPATQTAFPGRLEATTTDGSSVGIVSLGMTDFTLKQNGQEVNLKPGSSAKVHIPLYANTNLDGSPINLGDTVPLWSMSEKTGAWVQEGVGVVVDTGNGTRALEAMVTHFSVWNSDKIWSNDHSDPKPKCKIPAEYDTAFKQVLYCKFLAEMVDIFGDQSQENTSLRATSSSQPAWRVSGDALIGGEKLVVPAGVNVRLTGCVTSDDGSTTLCGSVIDKFVKGESKEFDILMQPPEKLTLPFDAIRNITTSQRFEFNIPSSLDVLSIKLEQNAGSSLNATARLFDESSGIVLATGSVNATALTLTKALLIPGRHILEIVPTAGSSGAIRLRITTDKNTNPITWKPFYQVEAESITPSTSSPCFQSVGNNTGRSVMAWVQSKTAYTLKISQYNPVTDAFDAATTLATNNVYPQYSYRCQVAVSSNNDAMIVWWGRNIASGNGLYWSHRAANENAWSTPAVLATVSPSYRIEDASSELKMDANGNASFAWLETATSLNSYQSRVSRFNPTTKTWTVVALVPPIVPPTNVTPMSALNLIVPSLDMDSTGNLMVSYGIFTQGVASAYPSTGIYSQKFDAATGNWLAPVLVRIETIGTQTSRTELKLGSNGQAVVMWQRSGLQSALFNPSTGVWTNVPAFSSISQAIAVNSSGVATIVAYSNPSNLAGQGQIQARTIAPTDAAWSAPQKILQSDGSSYSPTLAGNPTDDLASIFWTSSGYQFTSRASSAAAWTVPVVVIDKNSAATLSLDENGNALLVRLVRQISPLINTLEYQRISVH